MRQSLSGPCSRRNPIADPPHRRNEEADRGRVVRSAADFERPDPFRVEAAAATQVVVGDGVLRVVRDVESIPPKAMTLKIIQDGLEFLRPPGNSEMKRRKDRDHGEGGKHECTSSGRSAA